MLRRLRRALTACPPGLGLVVLLAVAAPNLGCGQTACFQWSPLEGVCPSKDNARRFFGNCNDIDSIDTDGKFANDLCCYSVTKSSGRMDEVDCSSEVGTGPSTVTASVTGGPIASTTVSSGPLPNMCDNSGFCGDTASGCIGCALLGPCAAVLDDCNASSECTAYSLCIAACAPMTATCVSKCGSQHPAGVPLFKAIGECSICAACPSDCSSMSAMCGSGSSSSGGGGMGGMSGSSSGMGGAGGK